MHPRKENSDKGVDFDSLYLQIGTRLQLEVIRDVKPVHVISSLIGYSYGEYIIVRMPDPRLDSIAFRIGEKITIRAFSGVKVFAFDVTVQRLFDSPVFYMHVSFPELIRASNLRSALRVKTSLPSTLQRNGQKASPQVQVSLRNLSVHGALIELPQQCGEVGEKVALSFTVPCIGKEEGESLQIEAMVRNITPHTDSLNRGESRYLYGVEFVALSQFHQLVLQNFTYESFLNRRQSLV